ncbi:hypothetical protein THAOC_12570 [Thalassiosira oceanica]|uniref:polynucleotide adenylyltransferase n=1 Tax=Thalassiosira oceanica TaxID=159749 RepID=K0T7R2_THAOC|nr:hypothetical protein THAOC_12570 [Thalassiosira oceanica]|eukprot:EJK66507.1 hypothetical protein THAOC_12570 [Thalassiosira oceanica]
MGRLHREWVRSVAIKRGLSPDAADSAGGELYTSGSYRLGVHEPGADIDTIAVAPSFCSRDDFFGSNYVPPGDAMDEGDDEDGEQARDPDSLAERIRRQPHVTNFVPVENAAVPILTFDWEGINIDLLFARLSTSSIPRNFDIDNDLVLSGVDAATEKSLNGPRVTNLIAALVGGTEQRYQTFLTVVRLVRKWAKNRGLYSNKMGYWGGVNINMAVALVLQLYPNACPASALRKFFLVFKSWRWPNPVMLTRPHDAELGLQVWNSHQAANMRQVAPMITPAYPAMNSTLSVSRQTLQILHEEFCRGHGIVDKLYKDYQRGRDRPGGRLCITGPTLHDAQAWAGFVESRLRKLVSDMLGRSLPLSKIQLWPKKFDVCCADKTALLTHAQRANSITYFIGFRVDKLRMRGEQLDIERQLSNFRKFELGRFHPLVPGMDILPKSFGVKELPTICFDGTYEGGKLAAMKRRRALIEADPKRIEAKKKKKLAKLKRKMEEIQRKKREAAAAKTEVVDEKEDEGDIVLGAHEGDKPAEEVEHSPNESRKRKREDDESHEDEAAGPDGPDQNDEEEQEEAALEDALDMIQDGDGVSHHKTREEAAQMMQKLLAGELLGEDQQAAAEEQKPVDADERDARILRGMGIIVSDDEATVLGGNIVLPWRRGGQRMLAAKKEEEGESSNEKIGAVNGGKRVMMNFKTQFDVVELSASGKVVDKGDEDFSPSLKWTGRRPGFEFKLGERGLGYYKTGRPVVIPSNVAYSK